MYFGANDFIEHFMNILCENYGFDMRFVKKLWDMNVSLMVFKRIESLRVFHGKPQGHLDIYSHDDMIYKTYKRIFGKRNKEELYKRECGLRF